MLTIKQTRKVGRSIWVGCVCGYGRTHDEPIGDLEDTTVQSLAAGGHFRCHGCGKPAATMVLDDLVTPRMLERWPAP